MVPGRTVSSGIPFWPVDTILSIQLLTEFVDRLERRCRNTAAEESVYARLLRACGRSGALEQGRRVHRHLQRHADDRSLFFGNRLVNMYSRCQSLEEARLVFDRMRERDVVSWTSIINAYTQNGHPQQALDLYATMTRDAHQEPNRVTFIALLGACDSPEFLDQGRSIHDRVTELGLPESDLVMGNAVMGMYRRCARSDLALRVFAEMRERDLIAWNTAIAASAESNDHARALVLLKRMLLEGVIADKVTFVGALNACIGSRSLPDGRSIHAMVAERALDRDVVLGTALVAMYGRCGCLAAAFAVFQQMPQRNAVSWNAMIAASAQLGEIGLAIALFKQMLALGDDERVEPTRVTFIAVLNAITTPETLEEGRKIHARIVERGLLARVEVANALVTMYGRCGSVEEAEEVFESTGAARDVVSWNAMLSVYAQRGLSRAVVELFHRMRAERVAANRITFLTALDACAEVGDLASGQSVHALSIEAGFGSCVSVCNAAMHLYASCCCGALIERAGEIFAAMPERDVISWNTMITGNVQAGRARGALLVFKTMLQEGIRGNAITFMSILSVCDSRELLGEGRIAHRCLAESEVAADPIVAAAAVSMHGKCGDLATARSLFDAMAASSRALPAWNAMISAYALHGDARAALDLAERMRREGVAPDRVTLITLLNACVIAGSIREGRLVHSRAIDAGMDADPIVTNAIVNMYSKCGDLELAASLFRAMDRRDVVSWNGMIAGLAHNGLARDAIKHLWGMQQDGVRPDEITFMITLSACSHAGFLRQAGEDFVAMAVDHGLERGIEHFGCMVDLLGRAGMIGDAEAFVGAMPGEEHKEVWLMTLLAACEVQGDEERAKRAAGSIVGANPRHSSAYVVLSNLYASGSDGAAGSSARFRRPRMKKPRVLGGTAD